MIKKIKNIIYLSSFLIFFVLIFTFYFSEQNIRSSNETRSVYLMNIANKTQDLILLENDTNNIVEYRNDIEVYKKEKKKYKFWELLKK